MKYRVRKGRSITLFIACASIVMSMFIGVLSTSTLSAYAAENGRQARGILGTANSQEGSPTSEVHPMGSGAAPAVTVQVTSAHEGQPSSASLAPKEPQDTQPSSFIDKVQQGSLTGYFEAIAMMFFLLACLWLILWLLKRSGAKFMPGKHQVMAVESRLAVGPKKWIMITRVHNRRFVIGVTDEHISLLTELDEAPYHFEDQEKPSSKQGTAKKTTTIDEKDPFAKLLASQ